MTKVGIIVKNHQKISQLIVPLGSEIATKGFYDPGDKGGAFYRVKQRGKADNISVIKLQNGYYAHLLPNEEGYINVRQLGAKGKGHKSDREAFKKAIQITKKIFIPAGQYRTETDVSLDNDIHIKGEKGAIIIGMFIIDGKKNITVEGLEFRSFNERWNYGVRIREKSAKSLTIRNCQFNNKSFIFQDYPDNENAIDTLIVDNCSFHFINEKENITITTIQVLAANLFITKCKFKVKGIDGCIKNLLGAGRMEVKNCEFYGDMDEEILDLYKYTGDFLFTNNKVNISRGGIIMAKPSSDRHISPFFRDCKYEFSHNEITHTGITSNYLVYFSGYYNLEKNIANIHQEVVVNDNTFNLEIIYNVINFRGIDMASFFNNKIYGKKIHQYSICLSGVQDLEIRDNIIDGGAIIASSARAPNTQKYRAFIENGKWKISNNVFNNKDNKEELFIIMEQSGVNINLEKNTFKNVKTLLSIRKGQYPIINLINNKFLIDSSKETKEVCDFIKYEAAEVKDFGCKKNQIQIQIQN